MINASTRQVLFYIVIVVLFVVTSTFIVAVTNGYLFNTNLRRFEKTGIISLATKQPPVEVKINGKVKVYKKSPITLSYLLPGYYDVEVKKDGYLPWSKTVYVHSGEVVSNPSVVLILAESSPSLADERQIAILRSQVPAREMDFDIRGTEIWVKPIVRTYPFIAAGDTYSLIARFLSPIVSARWLPGKGQLLFQVDDEIRIIDRDGANDLVVAKLSAAIPTLFTTVNDGKTLIYQDNGQVFQKALQ